MIEDIQTRVQQYWSWLKDETSVHPATADWVEITTPHLDRHNDYLQVYARREGDGYVITDDSFTIDDLEQSGCDFNSPRRKALLDKVVRAQGVTRSENRLEVRATSATFPVKLHALTQTMLSVGDLFHLSRSTVASLFFEQVAVWIEENEIRAVPDHSLPGKSGYMHKFDFAIAKTRRAPFRLVQTVTHPDKGVALQAAMKWLDVRSASEGMAMRSYVLLNDELPLPAQVLAAFEAYDMKAVKWSDRENVRPELAA